MPNILDTVQISGSSYDLKDKNAPSVSAVTQQEYDNLPSSAKTSNTFFVISDAQAGDLTNYYTKSETNTLLNGKQATLVSGTNIKTINNESLLGSGNIDIQGGGGKAIEAGRGISITTGETADTVSFNLPIYSGGTNSIKIGEDNGTLGGYYNLSVGTRNSITGENSIVVGADNYCNNTQYSAIFGYNNTLERNMHYCVVGGQFNNLKNSYETSFGNSSSSMRKDYGFGNSGNTLFTIGNGYDWSKPHNAFEVRQSGDIYIVDTNDTSTSNYYQKPMIKLQDTIAATAANTTALGGLSLVKLAQAEYDALATKDSNVLYVIVG